MGLPSHILLKAQEVTSILNPTHEDPTHKQKPSSPHNPSNITQPKGKGNLKRIARKKGKQAHDEQTQQKASLSCSKRPSKLVFPKDLEGVLPQNQLLRYQQWLLGSTIEHNEFLMLELSGNWEPPDSLYAARLCATMDSLLSLLNGDQSKTKTYRKNKIQFGLLHGLIIPSQGKSGGLAIL